MSPAFFVAMWVLTASATVQCLCGWGAVADQGWGALTLLFVVCCTWPAVMAVCLWKASSRTLGKRLRDLLQPDSAPDALVLLGVTLGLLVWFVLLLISAWVLGGMELV